jgi:hypothetical protein
MLAGASCRRAHLLRKRSHFGNEYRKTPPPKEKEKDQWGSGGLQAWKTMSQTALCLFSFPGIFCRCYECGATTSVIRTFTCFTYAA